MLNVLKIGCLVFVGVHALSACSGPQDASESFGAASVEIVDQAGHQMNVEATSAEANTKPYTLEPYVKLSHPEWYSRDWKGEFHPTRWWD